MSKTRTLIVLIVAVTSSFATAQVVPPGQEIVGSWLGRTESDYRCLLEVSAESEGYFACTYDDEEDHPVGLFRVDSVQTPSPRTVKIQLSSVNHANPPTLELSGKRKRWGWWEFTLRSADPSWKTKITMAPEQQYAAPYNRIRRAIDSMCDQGDAGDQPVK